MKIPEGYKRDPKGRLVPIELIKPVDLARDALVQEVLQAALALQEKLAAFKSGVMAQVQDFVEISASRYGADIGGQKGNVSLTSFDGEVRVVRAIADALTFDEGLQAAKALIDECIEAWTAGSRPEVRALINDAFQVDKEGLISTTRVLSLRRLDIDDETWQRAMRALSESLRVQCSKSYLRVERRNPATERYEAVRLDLAGV